MRAEERADREKNVVMFIGISVTPDPISLVTEFCMGGNLLDFCIKNKVKEKHIRETNCENRRTFL